LDDKLAEQIIKNLAYMGKILNKYEHLEKDDLSSEIKHDINIEWLIKKVLKEAKYELVNKPKETIKVRPNLYKNTLGC
jgi:hexokinase